MNNRMLEHGKSISIIDLPECEIKSHLLDIVKDCNTKVAIIAHVVGSPLVENMPWQVHISYPLFDDLKFNADRNDYIKSFMTKDLNDLFEYGDILPEAIAILLFPEWKEREYKSESVKE